MGGNEAHLPGDSEEFIQSLKHTPLTVGYPVITEVSKHNGLGGCSDGGYICGGVNRTVQNGVRGTRLQGGLPQILALPIPKDICGATLNLEDGGDFKYVTAQMDYNNIKLLLDSLTQQLYAVANVPAAVIGQGNIANVSEISLKLLFSQTDNKAKQMIQVLKEGMYKRFEYIRKLLALDSIAFSDDMFDGLDVTFTVNRPIDTNSLMNELKTQYDMGAISKQTIIDKSPYTVDTSLELQRIEGEVESKKDVALN